MMRRARTWRNSMPRNSPVPGIHSAGSSNSAAGSPGSPTTRHRNTSPSATAPAYRTYVRSAGAVSPLDVEPQAVGVLVAEHAVGPLGALGRAAHGELLADRRQIGDLLQPVLVGGLLGDDQGVLVLGRRRVEHADTLGLGHGPQVLHGGVEVTGRLAPQEREVAADVLGVHVDVAGLEGRGHHLAAAETELAGHVHAVVLEDGRVHAGDDLLLREVR